MARVVFRRPWAAAARPRLPRLARFAAVILPLLLGACASHTDRTQKIRSALDAGDAEAALAHMNEALDVKSEKDLPSSTSGDNALLLLDRAMVLQQLSRYELASRDLEVADKQVDLLDLSRNAAHDVSRYLFSDDVGPYKAPAYEKLLVNTENMLNYLARGDLNGARIEARRLSVMERYLSEHENPAQALLAPASYLAGFTYEKSGRTDEALRYYDEALAQRQYDSLGAPIRRLLGTGSYQSPRLRQFSGEPDAEGAEDGEILVVVSFGRVPVKIAKRVPIGLALTYASGALSPDDVSRANYLAGQGLVTWVNYPELERTRIAYGGPSFSLDGAAMPLESATAVDDEAQRAWESGKGTVVAAAITRMLSRVVAGEAIRQTSKDSLVGALLGLGVQATLTATDTPDTRSWQTLPARMAFGRVRVKPGQHEVILTSRGVKKRQTVSVPARGFAVVAHTVLF